MTALAPLITRELREESRQGLNYWLRVLVAFCLVLALAPRVYSGEFVPFSAGGEIFSRLHAILFGCIWAIVPLLVADCISREKREGTLGLLFLTPLTGGSIMAGKCFVHALRSSTLLIATLPVLTIPLLLGGVDKWDVLRSFIIDVAALIAALCCGLFASVRCRRWTRATLLAALSALVALYAFLNACSLLATGRIPSNFPQAWKQATGAQITTISTRLNQGFNFPNQPVVIFQAGGPGQVLLGPMFLPGTAPGVKAVRRTAGLPAQIAGAAGMLVLSLGLFVLLWLWAARRLRAEMAQSGPTEVQARIERTFCTPILWREKLHDRLRASLEWNPIGWLERYSWNARLAKWGWCLAAVVYEIFILNDLGFENFQSASPWFFGALAAGLALSSANSFSREKENGALELLLVTPLSESKIIWGRLGGLWMQILPGALIYGFMYQVFHSRGEGWFFVMPLVLAATAMIGLAISLARYSLLTRWLLTLFIAFALPAFLVWLQNPLDLSGPAPGLFFWFGGMMRYQFIFAAAAIVVLRENLRSRSFVKRASPA